MWSLNTQPTLPGSPFMPKSQLTKRIKRHIYGSKKNKTEAGKKTTHDE